MVLKRFINTDTEELPPWITQYCQHKGPLNPRLSSTMLPKHNTDGLQREKSFHIIHQWKQKDKRPSTNSNSPHQFQTKSYWGTETLDYILAIKKQCSYWFLEWAIINCPLCPHSLKWTWATRRKWKTEVYESLSLPFWNASRKEA